MSRRSNIPARRGLTPAATAVLDFNMKALSKKALPGLATEGANESRGHLTGNRPIV
jgi:hypothetical protein